MPDERPSGPPVLDLDALAPERPVVRYQGKEYTLKVVDDIAPSDLALLARMAKDLDGLAEAEGGDPEPLIEALRGQVRFIMVTPIEDDVIDSMTVGQMQRIADFFAHAADRTQADLEERMARVRQTSAPSTGVLSSPDSVGSTEAPVPTPG